MTKREHKKRLARELFQYLCDVSDGSRDESVDGQRRREVAYAMSRVILRRYMLQINGPQAKPVTP